MYRESIKVSEKMKCRIKSLLTSGLIQMIVNTTWRERTWKMVHTMVGGKRVLRS